MKQKMRFLSGSISSTKVSISTEKYTFALGKIQLFLVY
jgi:hypothetical protein